MAQGSVYRRGTKWYIRYDAAAPGQPRRQVQRRIQGTKRDAEKALAAALHEVGTGAHSLPSQITLADYLERFTADYMMPRLSPKTVESYRELIRLHITPGIGTIRLQGLKPLHIQRFYSQLLETGRRDGRGGLSARTVRYIHTVLRLALKYAVRWELIPRNPAELVDPPALQKRELDTHDAQETRAFLDSLHGSPYYLPALLAAATGMRRGEVLALKWEDIDLPAGILVVRRSLSQTGAGVREKSTKTGRERIVTLPGLLVDALEAHQAQQRIELALHGARTEFVVCRPDGSHYAPDSFTSQYTRWLKFRGITYRFHQLRHGHASQLHEAGIPLLDISRRLGHSGIQITADIYTHTDQRTQSAAAAAVNTILSKSARETNPERLCDQTVTKPESVIDREAT